MNLKKLFRQLRPSDQSPKFDFFKPEDGLLDENLQRAIEAVTADASVENRRHLYEILLKATFCLPDSGSDEDSATITAIKNEFGEVALVAFSDPPALGRWMDQSPKMMVLAGQALFQLAVDNGFAEIQINPAGPVGGRIPSSEFTLLAQGIIPD